MISQILIDRITRHEGIRLKPYKDTLGFLTIGLGRCLDTKGISLAEANYLLMNDLQDCVKALADYLPWAQTLDEPRFEVLVEMCFQLGIKGLLQFHTFLAALQSGDYAGAATSMLSSLWHKQTPARAEELAAIILNGNNH